MKQTRLIVAAILLAASSLPVVWATVETVPVALSGDPAPGCPGRTFAGFHRVTINDNGQIMFGAQLDSSDVSNNEGIWYGDPDAPALLMRKGDPAPGVPGRTIARFFISGTNSLLQHQWHPQHNNSGQVVVVAYLDGPDPSEEGAMWKGTPGNLQPIARAGEPAPGAPGRTFKWLANPLIDDAGNVMFYGVLDNFDRGFWYHGDAGLVPIAVEGGPVAGLGAVYTYLPMHGFDLAPTGEIAVVGETSDGEAVLLSGTPDAYQPVLRSGMEVPGVPGSSLGNFGVVRVRAGGSLTVNCQFSDPADPLVLQSGALYGPSDDLRLLARRGDPVPGTSETYLSIWSSGTAVNANGRAVLMGQLPPAIPGDRDFAIVTGAPGDWTLVAKSADPAPGSGGQVFGRPGPTNQDFQVSSINESGIVAFEALLPISLADGLWVWHEGELEAVAAGRTPFEVAPGDERVVLSIAYVPPYTRFGQGGTDGLNDRDEIAFDAAFLDGTRGVFVSGIRTVTNQPPVCDEAYGSITELWPPNHKFGASTILGVYDPDGDEVTMRVDAVTSDEPAAGPGNHAPDAYVDGADTVQLRAERFGDGNGRVYEIWFTASDGIDTCEGSVRVAVPHDRSGDPAIDDGQDHDATADDPH